jgi:hypothetical protein
MPKIDPPVETSEIPSTISINGVDYDPTEAQSLIDIGRKTKELETQWNTSVDKVWPEYGRSQEKIKTLEAERNDARAEIESFRAKQNAGVETPTDVREAQEAARKLGITLNEDLQKEGYLKKDDLDKYLEERDKKNQEVNRILASADSLEKEIDGSDGRPSFNKKIVLAYASTYGIGNLKEAYEDMNKDQLDKWKAAQVDAQKAKGLKTLVPGGAKSVKEDKMTDDNVKDRLGEALFGTE